MLKVLSILVAAFLLAACAANQPVGDRQPNFGPPSQWQGDSAAGMGSFTAPGGNWGPGNGTMHPATPGSFKGY
jgi:hypothetical protein